MSKEIHLTKGNVAIVDDDDFERVSKFKWCMHSKGYAESRIGGKIIYLHRFVMNAKKGDEIDHIDMNKLNNQKSNLRFCTRSQNHLNKKALKNNTSGFKGVCWDKENSKFKAQIRVNGKTKYLGHYQKAIDAAKAYDTAAEEMAREFSRTNSNQ